MNIKTDRLVIRTFEPEDWQDVYAYTSNPNVMKYIPEGAFTEEDARKFVTENSGEHAGKSDQAQPDHLRHRVHPELFPAHVPRHLSRFFHRLQRTPRYFMQKDELKFFE